MKTINLALLLAAAVFLSLLLPRSTLGQIPPDVTLEPVSGVSGLVAPLGIKNAGDGSGRLFIVQQGGTVRVIQAGVLLGEDFVDVSALTNSGGEQGLLDLAFHPEFALNGRFYLHYSAAPSGPSGTEAGDTVVAEFIDNGNPLVANTTPERIILTVSQDFSNHNGGQMRFGPDGYLYLGLGDGGSGNDPCDRGQTLDPSAIVTGGSCGSDPSVALLGKMLRIDVDSTTPAGSNNLCGANADGSAEYAVPIENPYSGQSDRCGEVLLHGLRNPWRWSFDRETQDLWIGDVGQNTTEEVSLLAWPVVGGENLGWKVCEGSTLRGFSKTPCTDPELGLPDSIIPVLEYPTGSTFGRSITGGYRYRGPIGSLQGTYVFGDAVSGNIWFATEDAGSWTFGLFEATGASVRSFGEDEQGNLYALSGSTLLRFEGDIADLIFSNGFETP